MAHEMFGDVVEPSAPELDLLVDEFGAGSHAMNAVDGRPTHVQTVVPVSKIGRAHV